MDTHTMTVNTGSPSRLAPPKTERNYGIDFLRFLSMLYVLILHTLGPGGVLDSAAAGSAQYSFSWFLEIWAYGAVDIFALISGYVAYTEQEKKVNYSNYIVLWLQVVAYGVGLTLLYKILHPEAVTKYDLFRMFLPVTSGLYWYFSAYTGLFLIMPVLNGGIRKCTEQSLKKLFVLMVLAFSVFGVISDRFNLANGYSFIWLVILYVLGGIMKKCHIGKNIKVYQSLVVIILCSVIAWAWMMFIGEVKIFGIVLPPSVFVNYISPTVLTASIFHIILFSKIRFSAILKKITSFLAAGAFSAYIINCQKFVWIYVMWGRFVYLADKPLGTIFIHTITFSLAFVVASVLVDHVRIWFFKLFRIRQLADRFVMIIDRIVSRLTAPL